HPPPEPLSFPTRRSSDLPESIGSIYGANLSTQTAGADSPDWPTSLGGVQVTVQDKTGEARSAPLAYVSPAQINFEVPAGTATGRSEEHTSELQSRFDLVC